jgi:hypothetical protein
VFPKKTRIIVGAVAFVALIGGAATVYHLNHSPARGLSSAAAGTLQMKRAQGTVDAENLKNTAHQQKFQTAGWQMTETPPPNPRIMALDPTMFSSNEEEMLVQIHSNSHTGEQLDNIREIVMRHGDRNEKALHIGIEALGRSHDLRAQDHLMSIYHEFPRTPVRRKILALLRPRHAGDATTAFLITQMENREIPGKLRHQAATQLATMSLARSRTEPDPELMRLIPKERHADFRRVHDTIRSAGNGGGK